MRLRLAGLFERKARVHMGAHPAILDALQLRFHPACNHAGLVPQVPEIDAEDGFVGAHQRERMEERYA